MKEFDLGSHLVDVLGLPFCMAFGVTNVVLMNRYQSRAAAAIEATTFSAYSMSIIKRERISVFEILE